MRSCSEAPHLCGMYWLLGSTNLLLSIRSTGAENSGKHGTSVTGSGDYIPVEDIQGGSVLFQMRNLGIDPGTELIEVEWKNMSNPGPISIVRVQRPLREGSLMWYITEGKQRFCVPSNLSLMIKNLTREDTGPYKAIITLAGGRQKEQNFYLTVYEPVPLPQILVQSESITRDWCNITLECRAKGITEGLNVTWGSQDLPMGQRQSVTPGPVPNPWTLAVNLSLSPNLSVICVVSNPVDQKNATKNLVEVCSGTDGKTGNRRHMLIIVMVIAVLILGFGLYLWKTSWKKKMETRRGSQMHTQHSGGEDGIQYADVIYPENQENQYESIGQRQMEKQESYTTVYSKVCTQSQLTKLT